MNQHHNAIRAGRARGFTLIEVLVAMGAVAMLAVGIAQIFSVTGKTVSAGRRLSNLSTYAGVLERQLRADLGSVTRDGFLMIRHDVANRGAPIGLTAVDPSPRARRVDELSFFASGQYTSQREPTLPGRNAQSTSARIYYGHGLQQDPTSATYTAPVTLSDNNSRAPGFGVAPTGGATNPNRYAANWILLRHVLLLQSPSNTMPDKNQGTLTVAANEIDNVVQVGLQPAVPDLFRTRAQAQRLPAAGSIYREAVRPATASGVVDVAATDLARIRAVVLGGEKTAPFAISNEYPPAGQNAFDAMVNMQLWMVDSLPADSDRGYRMRCEATPPNLLGIGWGNPQDYQKTDQAMLSASNFLPRCTEFIVEWSFGQVQADPTAGDVGRVLWYGMERDIDVNGDGTADYRVRPYSDNQSPMYFQVATARNGGLFQFGVQKFLINQRMLGNTTLDPLYSFFGYVDPLWTPPTSGNYFANNVSWLMTDVNRNGQYDLTQGDALLFPDTVPWAWPKMVRITVTLADPNDPKLEQTFQFIFTLPAQPGGSPL